jgi:hypothetical protein
MGSRFVAPALRVLPLADGATITVRERLTHGEQTKAFARMTTLDADGRRSVDALKSGDALILAYLVDWTLTDDSGAVVPIRGATMDELQDVLNNMDHASVLEIKAAIETHEAAVLAARDVEKKTVGATP